MSSKSKRTINTGLVHLVLAVYTLIALFPIALILINAFTVPADKIDEYQQKLEAAGIRVESDLRNEKINYKVREHSLAKVTHLLVVGMREAEEGTVAVRTLGEKEQKVLSLDEAIAMLKDAATPPDLRDPDA